MNEEERLRLAIKGEIQSYTCTVCVKCADAMTKKILSLNGICIKADVQTKPESTIDIHLWRDYSASEAYQTAQDDMQDAGFVKVVIPKENKEKGERNG